MKFLFSFIFATLMLAVQPVVADSIKIKRGANFNAGSLALSNGGGGALVYVFAVRKSGSKVALCGSYYATDGDRYKNLGMVHELLRQMQFSVGGKRLNMNASHFTFLREVHDVESSLNQPAKCRATNVPWKDKYAKELPAQTREKFTTRG